MTRAHHQCANSSRADAATERSWLFICCSKHVFVIRTSAARIPQQGLRTSNSQFLSSSAWERTSPRTSVLEETFKAMWCWRVSSEFRSLEKYGAASLQTRIQKHGLVFEATKAGTGESTLCYSCNWRQTWGMLLSCNNIIFLFLPSCI